MHARNLPADALVLGAGVIRRRVRSSAAAAAAAGAARPMPARQRKQAQQRRSLGRPYLEGGATARAGVRWFIIDLKFAARATGPRLVFIALRAAVTTRAGARPWRAVAIFNLD